jgi:hypothetical protein
VGRAWRTLGRVKEGAQTFVDADIEWPTLIRSGAENHKQGNEKKQQKKKPECKHPACRKVRPLCAGRVCVCGMGVRALTGTGSRAQATYAKRPPHAHARIHTPPQHTHRRERRRAWPRCSVEDYKKVGVSVEHVHPFLDTHMTLGRHARLAPHYAPCVRVVCASTWRLVCPHSHAHAFITPALAHAHTCTQAAATKAGLCSEHRGEQGMGGRGRHDSSPETWPGKSGIIHPLQTRARSLS